VPAGSLLLGSFAAIVTLPVAFVWSGALAVVVAVSIFAGSPGLRDV
jgi:hypothetical protein